MKNLMILMFAFLCGCNSGPKEPDRWDLEANIFRYAEMGNLPLIKKAIELGVATDSQYEAERGEYTIGATVMKVAVDFGHYEIVKYLLSKGASIEKQDRKGRSPLISAIAFKRNQILKLFLENGANPNTAYQSFSLAHMAIYDGNIEALKLLIKHNLNLGITDRDGCPLFGHAVDRSQSAIAEYLLTLEMDFDISCTKKYGNTIFDIINRSLSPKLLKAVIAKGVDINNNKSHKGYSPLHYAAIRGRLPLFKVLLEHRANFKQTDRSNNTALYYAMKEKEKEMVELLLKAGADPKTGYRNYRY